MHIIIVRIQYSPNETRSREFRASEKRLIPRKHRVSSVTSEITRNYRVLRVSRDYRVRLAFSFTIPSCENLRDFASVMNNVNLLVYIFSALYRLIATRLGFISELYV